MKSRRPPISPEQAASAIAGSREAAAVLGSPGSEDRYRGLFELNPRPLLVVDLGSGRVLESNEAAELHYGWAKSDFVNHPLGELWAFDWPMAGQEEPVAKICELLSGRWTHRKANGQTFEAQVSCRPINLGRQVSALLLVEDITHACRAAEFDAALSKLGRKLSETATPAEAGRVIADISRDLIGWDAFTITLYFPDRRSLVPVLAYDTIDGKQTELVIQFPPGTPPSPVFREVLENGSQLILRGEGEGNGGWRPFGDTTRLSRSLIFVPVKKGDQAVGVLSVQSYRPQAYSTRDLSTLEALASHCAGALDRLRIESALRTAEQKFAKAFEASPVAMYIGTFEDGRALLVNEAFEQVFGYSREEILGRNGLELGLWEDPGDRAEIYEAIRSGRRVRDMQVRLQTRAGELRQMLVSVEVIEVEGERCLLFYNYDITERVKLEAQLRQSQKLESIGQVAAGVAHDFNNMLTVIDGCTSLALAGNRLEGETRELVERISAAAGKAANVTRQLLAFSSRQKMVVQQFSLQALLEELTGMLQPLVGSRVRLQVRCTPRLPLISGDPGMIEQVVVNMAANARDAMPEGGRLAIEAREVPAERLPAAERSADRYLCIRIKDTGRGISPGNLPKLFEPFFTTKEIGKGSGLGLPTAYGIVKQHGGWIDVRSRIGEGTEFLIYLPACGETAPAPAAAAPSPKVPLGQERILVVEDEPTVRDLVCHVLRFYGYETLEAESGPAALEIWQNRAAEIDAVVTDIVMPGGMDGRELASRLLKDRPSLPVLYTSGYSPAIAGRDLPLEDGINFLQKPFEASALAQTLRACLDRANASR